MLPCCASLAATLLSSCRVRQLSPSVPRHTSGEAAEPSAASRALGSPVPRARPFGASPRIASRNLFDLAIGDDNLFKGDRYKWSAQVNFINITNNYALYNFLSTFSGTHYVTPRTITGTIGFHF